MRARGVLHPVSEGSLEGQGPQSTWEREDKAEDQRVTGLRPLSRRAVSAPGRGGPGSHLGSGCQDPAPPPLSPGPPSEVLHKDFSQASRGRVRGKGNPTFNPSAQLILKPISSRS